MKQTHTNLLLVVLLLALVVSGCTQTNQTNAQQQIVTTIFPLYDFARIITAGTNTTVNMLLPPGAEPHTYELKPSDIATISKAQLFIYVGETFEPWAESVIQSTNIQNIEINSIPGLFLGSHEESHEHETVSCEYSALYALEQGQYTLRFSQVDGAYAEDHITLGILETDSEHELDAQLAVSSTTVSDGQSIKPSTSTVLINFAQDTPVTQISVNISTSGTYGICTEHLPSEFGETFLLNNKQQPIQPIVIDVSDEKHHHHDEGYDPHVWLSVKNAQKIVMHIAQELAKINPEYAQQYTTNAQAYSTKLQALDAEFATAMLNCSTRTIISAGHDAYYYLENAYNLSIETAFGISPDSEPTPRRIAQLYEIAKEHNATHIVFESAVSPAVAQTLANELSIQTAQLHPLDSITKESFNSNASYISEMRQNIKTISRTLGCK
jgi:zinc transport system substrate-binding protein